MERETEGPSSPLHQPRLLLFPLLTYPPPPPSGGHIVVLPELRPETFMSRSSCSRDRITDRALPAVPRLLVISVRAVGARSIFQPSARGNSQNTNTDPCGAILCARRRTAMKGYQIKAEDSVFSGFSLPVRDSWTKRKKRRPSASLWNASRQRFIRSIANQSPIIPRSI